MKTSHEVLGLSGRGRLGIAAAAWLAASLGWAQPAPLPSDSPFLPPGNAATAAPAETLEFAGVSVVGDRTDLIFHNKATKKTSWVRLGATANGISALKYDSRTEQAVVRVNGVEKVLTLRKGTGPVNAPMPPPMTAAMPPAAGLATGTAQILPAPAPTGPVAPGAPVPGVAPAVPGTAEAVAKQETEARMLVSDLLEIGMAQRKAYEEAQAKKAAEQPGAVMPAIPPPPPAQPPPPVQPPAAAQPPPQN